MASILLATAVTQRGRALEAAKQVGQEATTKPLAQYAQELLAYNDKHPEYGRIGIYTLRLLTVDKITFTVTLDQVTALAT